MPSNSVSVVLTRLNKLEDSLEKHLIESGEVRSDLAWLKKAFWVVAGASVTGTLALIIQLVVLILKR